MRRAGVRERAALTARTLVHLRPAQVGHRLRLRAQRAALARLPLGAVVAGGPAGPPPGWPPGFVALDAGVDHASPDPEANADRRFSFLGEQRRVGEAWDAPGAARLWRYHLHYFEWAWSFAAHPDRAWAVDAFARLWRSWKAATPLGRGDAWSPYVASLRAWALCGVFGALVAGSGREAEVGADLAAHARFLRAHLELDVGGNHLVKNLKALVGLGVFLGDPALAARAAGRLVEELGTQVLGDGGHFELSPSYHCQVLGDLIDVAGLLDAAGLEVAPELGPAVEAMRGWLAAMVMPDGDVALVNDAVAVGRERLGLVLGPRPPAPPELAVLGHSGYVVVRSGDLHLVADVGPPCPPELPAHAHADCLSFELAVGGRRVVADTGTSTYAPGARRAYERSTAAHNTVVLDGADQTEVWGTFRAARRARARLERVAHSGEVVELTASHDGYRRLPGAPRHTRTWRLGRAWVEVIDRVEGRGRHRVAAHLHLRGSEPAPGPAPATLAAGPLTVAVQGPPGTAVEVEEVELATGFGARQAGRVVVASVEAELPVVLRTRLEVRA